MESTAPPARCEIARLPEELLSAALARTAPRDACRADAVWSSFLPRDQLPPLADGELPATPLPKKELFMRLSDSGSPVLLPGGLTSMWLDRAAAAKCYMLSARKLGIIWGDTQQYWRWIPLTDSRMAQIEQPAAWWADLRIRRLASLLLIPRSHRNRLIAGEPTMESTATAPARCEIERLPDDLLSATLARTTPEDACRAAAVSPAFRAAADADAVWASFLPRDMPPLADGELPAGPQSTKKQLFMRLSDSARPVLLADGLASMWLDRATGAKCYMLSARKLDISCSTPQYLRWIPITGSRSWQAAALRQVSWLHICAEMDSKMLSQHMTYSAYIVYKYERAKRCLCCGLCKETSVSLGGRSRSTRQVCLDDGHDGWMEVKMGEFRRGEDDDDGVSITLKETTTSKRDVVVLGVEIRPKEQVV